MPHLGHQASCSLQARCDQVRNSPTLSALYDIWRPRKPVSFSTLLYFNRQMTAARIDEQMPVIREARLPEGLNCIVESAASTRLLEPFQQSSFLCVLFLVFVGNTTPPLFRLLAHSGLCRVHGQTRRSNEYNVIVAHGESWVPNLFCVSV